MKDDYKNWLLNMIKTSKYYHPIFQNAPIEVLEEVLFIVYAFPI